MNPFPVIRSLFAHKRLTLLSFVVLIAFAVGLGVAITAQERALRQGSARAADKFDLLVGAPGSQFDLVLASVYLRITSMELLPPDVFSELMNEEQIEWAAPIAFGDSAGGYPIVGTTLQLIDYLSPELGEGRPFGSHAEAVVGAEVELGLGHDLAVTHGVPGNEEHAHEERIEIVGRMARTDTPWDRAIIVPIEQVWEVHGLPSGHAPDEEDEHGPEEAEHAGEQDHAHEDEEVLGPPFDPAYLAGVPAVLVKPINLAAAYGLRNKYRTERSQALFPAEILVQLYAIMGDARQAMNFLALATQLLVVAATLSGLSVVLQLHTGRLAVLRALGATPGYVFLVAWVYVTLLMVVGGLCGLGLGYAVAQALSAYLTSVSGFAIRAVLTWDEVLLVVSLLAAGAVLAALPALALFRRPVIEALR